MAPKQKKLKLEKSNKKRNKSDSESSSDPLIDEVEADLEIARSIAAPRATRASARACKAKNRDDSWMEATIKASLEETKVSRCNYDFHKLRTSDAYVQPSLYRKMEPEDFNMDYYNRTGLNEVLMFSCPPEKLGMKMVDENFTVRDVETLVGGNKMITCVEVATQNSKDMPLKDFIDYYYTPKEDKKILYNVLSLEFSNTGLADKVRSPALVRAIDWASTWPDERKNRSVTFDKEGKFTVTNHFPRVENYCLMSPTECYTDFHIDFHGTSVWYHVKKGMKIFWIVEPTEQNLKLYEEFLKARDHNYFFGDVPEKCARVEVMPGNTLIIPSGWIHSVFTPCDSLVFGGNFLHSRQALMQLNVLQGENRIGINKKYRYPYSEEMVFFYLNNILQKVTGRQYIRPESRNQQDSYMEYIGKLFEEKGGHRRIPKLEDYEDEGVAWNDEWEETPEFVESRKKLAKWDKEEENDEQNGEKVEASTNGTNGATDDEKESKMNDSNLEKEDGYATENGSSGGHYDFFVDDSTLYHPRSFNLDAGTGATAMHTLPLSHNEPKEMPIDRAILREEIHPENVPQLEGLIVHYLKRPKVDLPIGLTRPNSLLQAFCTLLRERRILAEMDGIFSLPPCILPDQDGSRKLHEEQKAAAEERRRKWNEKKEREANGDGEYDSDWNPDDKEKPKAKKPRKSEDGKTVEGSPQKRERGVEAPKNLWNAGFCKWYRLDGRELVDKHKAEFPGHKELKEFIRKTYYTTLDKQTKNLWMERAQLEWRKKAEKSTPLSPSNHSDRPSTSKDPPFTPSSCMSASSSVFESDDTEMGNGQREAVAPLTDHSDYAAIGTSIVRKKKKKEVNEGTEETEEQKRWNVGTKRKEQVQSSPPAAVKLVASNNESVINAMKQKLAMEGRLNKAVLPARRTITECVSGAIIMLCSSGENTLPRLFHYTDPHSFATPEQQVFVAGLKSNLRDQINSYLKLELTLGDIESHIAQLKTSAVLGNHLSGKPIPFLKSVQSVARAIPHTVAPPPSGISSKQDDSAVPIQQPQTMVEEEAKEEPSVSFKENDVMDKTNEIAENERKEDDKEESENRVEKTIDGGKSENSRGKKTENQSDFRLVRANPKPPDQGKQGGKERTDTVTSDPTRNQIMKAKRRAVKKVEEEKKETEEENEETGAPNIRNMKKPMKEVRRRKEKGPLISDRDAYLKEEIKEEDINDDLLSNEESSVGNVSRVEKDSYWKIVKDASEKVIVRKFTEKFEDWTPFDAFLRRNYKKFCAGYDREPSNAFALKIKREVWDSMATEGGAKRYEEDAEKFIREKRKRVYWNSETVVEQEDRIVEDKGLKLIPLGGEEKKEQGKSRSKSESSDQAMESKNEDEYWCEDDDEEVLDDEMIDVEGVEDEVPLAQIEVTESSEPTVKDEEEKVEMGEPPKKKSKGGRPKKEPVVNKKKKTKEENEDFMQSGSAPRGKGKKAKPDPNKPLIVDGLLVNPLPQQAVANAYGYDPAMDIVALGRGQLKSAYRRSKAQLDTPQIDVKRYKLEVKHDHLLDDDDHDDTHRDDTEVVDSVPHPTTHGGAEITEGINMPTGDAATISPSLPNHQQPAPFHLQQRSSSFSRRPSQPMQKAPPPLIPHAPSPITRRVSGAATDGWGGGRRRSDGERRDRSSGNRSPPRRSNSHYSPADSAPLTPSTPSTPAPPLSSLPSSSTTPTAYTPTSTPSTSSTPASTRPNRLAQAEKFSMAAPKVIDAPRLATPIVNNSQSFSHSPLEGSALNGDEPLTMDVFCLQMERITSELDRANSVLANIGSNGN